MSHADKDRSRRDPTQDKDGTGSERSRLEGAEDALGHRFHDRSWLLQALTHRSYLNENRHALAHNEVLEWVGDAVLSLVAVDALLEQTPDATEGGLTDRRSRYVSEEALAVACDRAGVDALLRVGKGLGGRVPVSARADLIEALIGAVYKDAGLEAARAATLRLLGEPPRASVRVDDHAKRLLQERLQGLFGDTPAYVVSGGEGPPHAPVYRADVTFQGQVLGTGAGGNKRVATEAAAVAALEALPPDSVLRTRFRPRARRSAR